MLSSYRLRYACRRAGVHLCVSFLLALASSAIVFGFLYPSPYREILIVGKIYVLLLCVDVVCGPLLTLIISSPQKHKYERWLDFSLIGVMQVAALLYGMHSVWLARPAVLAFDIDRLLIVTANEVMQEALPKAPTGLQHLPWAGVLKVGVRQPTSTEDVLRSFTLDAGGMSAAMLPDWWLPWNAVHEAMRRKVKPLTGLIAHRPEDADALRAAAKKSGRKAEDLSYLPLTSRNTKEWIALLDTEMNMVGYAQVEGF
jgi:hypothetical protein